MIDPKTIFFSTSTINDALPAMNQAKAPTSTDLMIHEDEWRQFEVISLSYENQINDELASIRHIHNEKSQASGDFQIFSEIHARTLIPKPIIPPLSWTTLLEVFGAPERVVVSVGIRDHQGVIQNGFAFQVAQLTLFGLRQGDGINVLCFVSTRSPSLNTETAEKVSSFFEDADVVLVHWPSASKMIGKEAMKTYLQQASES